MTATVTITITSAQTTITNTRDIDLDDSRFYRQEQLTAEVSRLTESTSESFIKAIDER